MGEGDPLYRAVHLGLEQWNNIPDSSRIRGNHNHDHLDIEHGFTSSKVISFLFNFMAKHLTARQFEVMRMYHLDYRLTQDAIARVLGITQPTVSQHLHGKKRDGKSVGGAYRRIRKEVYRIANNNNLPPDERRILHFLMSLSQSDIPPKQRRGLLLSLQ